MKHKGIEGNLPSRISVAKAYDIESFLSEFKSHLSEESVEAIEKIASQSSLQNAITLVNAENMRPEVEILVQNSKARFTGLETAESDLLLNKVNSRHQKRYS